MTIVSISWVRNESDIIESFVRYHCRIFDHMRIVDNASTDDTRDILHRLQEEGLPIEVDYNESSIHMQEEAITDALHDVAARWNPDWVVPLDGDEFLMTHKSSVRAVIETLPQDTMMKVRWQTYIPTEEDDKNEHIIVKRMRYRRTIEQPQFHKIMIPRPFQTPSCTIPMGSHLLLRDGQPVPALEAPTLFLAHFPVRSPTQIQRKIVESWERHTQNPHKQSDQNYHWKKLYEEMLNGPPTPERLRQIALNYTGAGADTVPDILVEDPIAY